MRRVSLNVTCLGTMGAWKRFTEKFYFFFGRQQKNSEASYMLLANCCRSLRANALVNAILSGIGSYLSVYGQGQQQSFFGSFLKGLSFVTLSFLFYLVIYILVKMLHDIGKRIERFSKKLNRNLSIIQRFIIVIQKGERVLFAY